MNTGEISGSVKDPLEGLVPGATIIAELAGTGQRFSAVSNSAGEFLLAQLPVGTYTLKATATSFKPLVISSVDIHLGDKRRYELTLQLGGGNDVVTVAADERLQLESAQISDVLGKQQVNNLLLKTRQFLDLAMLSEGVVRPPGGTRGDALQQAGTLVNVLGQRSGHNLYLLDGVTVTDEHFNNMVVAPSVDAIEEFSIQKTSYAPEFGGKSGAVINVATKSGTDRFHGSLFEFIRNDIFDAKNYFDSPKTPIPPFRQNQFGGSFGGPFIKHKGFFFIAYEGQRIRKSLTQTFSVPTEAMRSGNFAGSPTIYDPNSGTGDQRQPFANNQIPVQLLNSAARNLLSLIPLPSIPGTGLNLLETEGQRVNANTYTARLDHQFASKDNTFLRAALFDARQFDPFGSGVLQETLLPGFGRFLSTHSINGAAGWTHTFTPDILNETRFGFLAVAGGQRSPNAGNGFAAANGIQGVTTIPADVGYPQFSFGGQFTTMGDPALFTFRDNHDFELYDNLIVHHGSHTLKAGAYLMHYDLRPVNPNGARGVFSFTPRWTSSSPGMADGNAFADFLLGYPTTAQAGLGRADLDANTNWAHFYAQDTWQISSKLKVDLGVRYEYNQNMTDSQNRFAAVDPSVPGGQFVIASDASGAISPAATPLLPYMPIAYTTSAAAGWNNSLLTTRPLRLAPRAGLAYTLPKRLRTVLRAGFGIYPNQAAYGIITNFGQNLPFFVTKTATSSTTTAVPPFSIQNALTALAIGTVGANNLNHSFKIEYNEVWNLNLERELSRSTTLSVAYIGSRTVHADSSTVQNVPLPGPGAIAARRPIPQMGQFTDIRWDGWAAYHALTIAAKRRLAKGLTFDANWTWSHSIDDASDPGTTLNETNLPQNVYDLRSEKASSSFDHRHRFVISFVYELPQPHTSRAWVRGFLSDWQTGGYFTAQAGAPFTVNIATDQANIGSGPAQRPNASGDPNNGPKTPKEWFNTAVFSVPALYTFGDAPRNAVIGPGLQEFDASAQKQFAIREAVKVQFRAEAYNVFNHPNFNIPNRTVSTANFGRISSAQDSRQMQFAVKLVF